MKSDFKGIGFGKQNIAQVFDEWFTIPSYQRHYVWDSDNIYDMLEDFTANYIEYAHEEYFLGSYIIQNKTIIMTCLMVNNVLLLSSYFLHS